MSQKMLSLLCVCALLLTALPAAAAADTGNAVLRDSGSTAMEKLTKEEIVQLLAEYPDTMPSVVYTVQPSTSAPYAPGTVSTQALQQATDRLNALRRLAGVPEVRLDTALCENAQYGAVLMAANGDISHTPGRPTDMEESFYQQGYEAASSSNLYAGVTLTTAPDGFMDDSDASNISRVGHRRWQLNPDMGKVGFGYAESNTRYRSYVVEKVFDRSGSGCDYDFIAWPASGNFPSNTDGFTSTTAWSVSLNPEQYAVPSRSALTVTLVRESDGKSWVLGGNESYTASNSGRYLNVDTGGYGVSNCIIFRPDGVESYEGVYTVTIDGLKSKSGSPVDFSYQVDFFDASGDAEDDQTSDLPENPSDQPSSWAQASVTEAIGVGIVPTALQSQYTQAATRGEFCALAVQLYETVTGSPVSGRSTFTDTSDVNVEKAAYLGVVSGVGDGTFRPNDPLNREQAAVMLTQLAKALGKPLPQATANFGDAGSISSWALQAVGQVQASGVMNGVGGGLFAPAQGYSREQSITTMLNLYQVVGG